MKTIQMISGFSLVYFFAQMAMDRTQEGKSEAFMALLMFLIVFLMASHLIGIKNRDIADEIKNNKDNTTNNSDSSLFKSSLDEIFDRK